MLRQIHSLAGLIGALLVMLIGLTGAVLSINPALERLATSVPAVATRKRPGSARISICA